MEFMSRGGRGNTPAPQPNTTAPAPASGGGSGLHHKIKARGESMASKSLFLTLVGALAILVLSVALYSSMTDNKTTNSEAGLIKTNQYQAVFLNNNQVYFGKIKQLNDKYVVIEDVFYLQVNQSVQPNQQQQTDDDNLVLQKLGATELHKPDDRMVLNREQITFWENIKDDGQVVTAIKRYKENPAAANATTPTNTNNTTNTTNNSTNTTTTPTNTNNTTNNTRR